MCCSMYGKKRSTNSIKRPINGGELLLSPGLGASEGMRNGNGIPMGYHSANVPSINTVESQKPQMNNIIKKLEGISLEPKQKRKNIRFQI